MAAGKISLRPPGFRHAEIVVAEIGRDVRLMVARKERLGLADVRPLGEALPPPLIVLRNGMKLGQIERHQPGTRFVHGLAF